MFYFTKIQTKPYFFYQMDMFDNFNFKTNKDENNTLYYVTNGLI